MAGKFDFSGLLNAAKAGERSAVATLVTYRLAKHDRQVELVKAAIEGIAESDDFKVIRAGEFAGWRGDAIAAVMNFFTSNGQGKAPSDDQLACAVVTWTYYKETGSFKLQSVKSLTARARSQGASI